MALFLDLDNTLLPSKPAYDFAIGECGKDWKARKLGGDFFSLYELTRKKVKNQLISHSSNRLRLLCFKLMLDELKKHSMENHKTNELESKSVNDFQTKDIADVLWMEERYHFHFLSYLKAEAKKEIYQTKLFPKLVALSNKVPVFLTTNETLRTQLLKVSSFLPDHFRFTLITSEEVGFEKPTTEFFSYVLEASEENPEDSILLGDNWEDDVLGANRHGIASIHIPNMWGEGEVKEYPSDTPAPIWTAPSTVTALEFAELWFLKRKK
ncbi:HAD family hydrolase [Leptospira congkakensis]|uniref:HAD family hydrolase n=1 Tax=Leptospira congkakensis TaxID=2484932 RepID=A0A4Z1A2F8_9LEPT|nr:HAD family hydrolase [Leptospira congkakensis]TGL85207.1 HAD family hydrolase [Leptospira congkakensis]TGL92919.1 HAD family hydrolase [Leptospira congkakensis]TGL96105.1 HAD family hydrolase [Leptospira congkakensis]